MMKTHTKVFYGTLFAALLLAAPMIADARPFGHGCGPGDCYGNGPGGGWSQSIPDDKRDAARALMQAHRDKVQPLYDAIWVKETTLRTLRDNPNVKPSELTALIDEMASLRAQIREEHRAFAVQVKKETGVDTPYGCGMQGPGFKHYRGMDGDGPGGRHGGRHGGYHGGRGMW